MTQPRLIWADSLKGWLMLLVILGHAIQGTLGYECNSNHVFNFIYSFHMPAFIAVSGWLLFRGDLSSYTKKEYLKSCKRRSLQLLVPYFVWIIITFIRKGDYTLQASTDFLLYPDHSFWFLWVLFWIFAIFRFAQLVAFNLKINEIWIILCTCLLLLGLMVTMEIRILGFQFLSYYFLFYTVGYFLHKFKAFKLKVKWNRITLVIFFFLWIWLAWGWTMHGLPSWIPAIPYLPSSLLQYAYRGFTALVAILIINSIAPKILNNTQPLNNTLCHLGIVSLGLYVVHLSIMDYIVDGIQTAMPSLSTWACIFLAFIMALTISYFIVWLLNKNKYTAIIFIGKYH